MFKVKITYKTGPVILDLAEAQAKEAVSRAQKVMASGTGNITGVVAWEI